MSDKKITKIGNGFSIGEARKDAEEELLQERQTEVKAKIKGKLRELANAKQIVANVERELNEMEHELANGIG